MKESFTDKVDIYISVDMRTIKTYFNAHDPSPIYKKQINQKFEHYILNTASIAKRYSAIFYKLNCIGSVNRQYTEPLMHAIKRHFSIKKAIKQTEFKKFKKRNTVLLVISAAIVITLEALLPFLVSESIGNFYNGIKNCLDVFSWVILWKPIYDLLFSWNSYLKDILLFKKLSTAEVIIIEDKMNNDFDEEKRFDKADSLQANNVVSLQSLLSI